MSDFDIDLFYKNHKKEDLGKWLMPYRKSSRLKGYRFLKKDKLHTLALKNTYIKYVRTDEAFMDDKYRKHIRCGGILLAGGTFVDGEFSKLSDRRRWTHILVKYDPSKIYDAKGHVIKDRRKPKIYTLKLNRHYLFYRVYGYDIANLKIELIK